MSISQSKIITSIKKLLIFLEPNLKLANCHMVDFFTNYTYNTCLPHEICNEINEIGIENVIDLILNEDLNKTIKLKQFIEECNSLNLKNFEFCLDYENFNYMLKCMGENDIERFNLKVFIKEKKSHEVEILSSIVASIAKVAGTSHLVDIGDGKGYLSSILAMQYKIPILGVDSSYNNTSKANERAKKLFKIWNSLTQSSYKTYPKNHIEPNLSYTFNKYKQITKAVDENCDFSKIVSDVFLDSPMGIGLVGLHTCGNLSTNSLKIYNTDNYIKTICNVGCCYHLLTEAFENEDERRSVGFPLSKYLLNKKTIIGRNARMLAAQSVDRILDRKELPKISIFHRALFQVLLEKYYKKTPSKPIGKFRKPCKSFLDYARKCIKRMDILDLEISDEDINNIYITFKNRLDELNVFYLIRSKLSPVIESLILLDRLLFLIEQEHSNTFLVKLFNPVISPRCYGLISFKKMITNDLQITNN